MSSDPTAVLQGQMQAKKGEKEPSTRCRSSTSNRLYRRCRETRLGDFAEDVCRESLVEQSMIWGCNWVPQGLQCVDYRGGQQAMGRNLTKIDGLSEPDKTSGLELYAIKGVDC